MRELDNAKSLLNEVEKRDILLSYPYQSFDYIIRLLREAHPILFLELHGPESEKVAWDTLTSCGYTLHAMQDGYPQIKSPEQLGWKAYVIAQQA